MPTKFNKIAKRHLTATFVAALFAAEAFTHPEKLENGRPGAETEIRNRTVPRLPAPQHN